MISDIIFSTVTESIIKAIISGNKFARKIFIAALVALLFAIGFFSLSELLKQYQNLFIILGFSFAIISVIIMLFLGAYNITLENTKQKEEYIEIEKLALENPEKTSTAWDLARIKLESYLNRNLIHIKWIFTLILIVMLIGFAIIIYGVLKIYDGPLTFQPSVVVTISGLIVEFVATTFLIIYKSTMKQAQDYVNVLERINAIGMAVQISDTITSTNTELKEQTKSELVKQLLSLYRK